MGRHINTRLPTLEKNLKPQWPDLAEVRVTDQKAKAANCYYYNRHHVARSLPVLQPGDAVRVKLDAEKEWRHRGFSQHHTTPQGHMLFKPLMAGTERTANTFKRCHLLVRDTQ